MAIQFLSGGSPVPRFWWNASRPAASVQAYSLRLDMGTRNDYRVMLVWAGLIGLVIAALWFKVPLG